MRAVVQKTLKSSVTSDGVLAGQAGSGLTVLLGVSVKDTDDAVRYLADKIVTCGSLKMTRGNSITPSSMKAGR